MGLFYGKRDGSFLDRGSVQCLFGFGFFSFRGEENALRSLTSFHNY